MFLKFQVKCKQFLYLLNLVRLQIINAEDKTQHTGSFS